MKGDEQPRQVLPIPDLPKPGLTTFDAKDPDSTYPPITPIRPPEGAPNVLVILLDDVGYGAPSVFGGPAHTPTAERLAKGGLSYNRFHTTALCAPTRAALLTGRNHHSVGFGCITEMATSAPGNNAIIPKSKAPLAKTLKYNGYSTAQFGKCHEVAPYLTSPMGPFDAWPAGGGGFEYFYGFIAGEANQYDPALYEGLTPIDPPKSPEEGYHLTEDLADKAIGWIEQQKALMADKPFFIYFAPGATHAPHHVPEAWRDRYAGQFDAGWDAIREQTFARQKELGIIPEHAELTARPEEIPAWDDMPDEMKPVLARQMEIYAAFLEHTDHQVGRVINHIDEIGALGNTLVYYIIGDNGASAEGTMNGSFNEMANFNGMAAIETPEFMQSVIDQFGGPDSYNHYSTGWAHAMCTPYQWTKQIASHWGGTRNATIVHWPDGIAAKGEIRDQFAHVIDVAPTILEAAGIPEPQFVDGIMQSPMEGTSMSYTFSEPKAAERHELQYFEMVGNRGIYHKGWSAVTIHEVPWKLTGDTPALDDDTWELYDGSDDFSQAKDLAAENPEKLAELQRLFLIEATKYNVLPIDDRKTVRMIPEAAGRPTLIHGNRQMFFPSMGRLSEHSVVDTKNKSWSLEAHITLDKQDASGVIMAQGGKFGGWSVYLTSGRLGFVYNTLGIHFYETLADHAMGAGEHQILFEFDYDGGGLGKGGDVTLQVDGEEVGRGRVEMTHPMIWSAEETANVGRDAGTPVGSYSIAESVLTDATVKYVEIAVGDDAKDHDVDPLERFRLAMKVQ